MSSKSQEEVASFSQHGFGQRSQARLGRRRRRRGNEDGGGSGDRGVGSGSRRDGRRLSTGQ